MTPHHTVTLAAYSRKELEEWMSAVKQAAVKSNNVVRKIKTSVSIKK